MNQAREILNDAQQNMGGEEKMKLSIVIPFEDAARMAPVWAFEERSIDFRREAERAARCTAAFAAHELRRYLLAAYPDLGIAYAEKADGGICVALGIDDHASRAGDYALLPSAAGLAIKAAGRAGLMYGVYDLLEMQGYRWYMPGPAGEVFARKSETLILPSAARHVSPSMSFGRGFEFEYISMESADLALWMARNRMNVTAWRAATGPLCAKLGMTFKAGGHIFEEILNPERPMPSGRTLWEDHAEWFGLPKSGRRVKAEAQRTQLCVSRPDLIAFLGEELVEKLNNEFDNCDRVDVWGFDTWGSGCQCEGCLGLGNGTDQTLHLFAGLKDSLAAAWASGRLSRQIDMVLCAYEGTDTIQPPERPIPETLVGTGTSIAFAPIQRCYAHAIFDPACARNAMYDKWQRGWLATQNMLPFGIVEYYNVSKFEDLPLALANTIVEDIPYYYSIGARGMTYMHVPMVNWGIRALTQCLYARLMFDVGLDAGAFIDEYFANMYGGAAEDMRHYFGMIQRAWRYISSWRAWHMDSALSQLLQWDGGIPEKRMRADGHFSGLDELLLSGKASVDELAEAGSLLEAALERARLAYVPASPALAVNPAETRAGDPAARIYYNLCEAARGHRYCADMMRLLTLMAKYHTVLAETPEDPQDERWREIEQTVAAMERYYVPIQYDYPGAGMDSRSAIERSQLGAVVARARAARRRDGKGESL
jgi:hypothetical protein